MNLSKNIFVPILKTLFNRFQLLTKNKQKTANNVFFPNMLHNIHTIMMTDPHFHKFKRRQMSTINRLKTMQ